jgi:UDP-GlcNAc3NAcA epimerase
MKILTVIGARPQFIKAAAFSHALKTNKIIKEVIVHTGQHYDLNMSKIFFDQLNIPRPAYRLDSGGKSHAAMTAYQLCELENILSKESPDYLLLYGDTNSTLSGALAASKLNIPVIHIEAGLRSFNNEMPEEINRIITDRLSKILFCPSEMAKDNLIKEGYEHFNSEIHVVGDIMYDTVKLFANNMKLPKPSYDSYVMCTIHRQENTNSKKRFKEIIKGLNKIAKYNKVIFPIHPRTQKIISDFKISLNKNILIKKPMSYIDFINYLKYCEVMITDSGGIQKESYFMRKNCLILREETEWRELVENNFNSLCGFNHNIILEKYNNRSHLSSNFDKQFYGDGNTADKILKILSSKF